MVAQYREPTPAEIQEQKLYLEMGLTESEYEQVVELLGRLPNYTETGLFGVMWSDHCSYKNSKPLLSGFHRRQAGADGTWRRRRRSGYRGWAGDCFQMESHNHPSAVSPSRCRRCRRHSPDVYSMGARPIAL